MRSPAVAFSLLAAAAVSASASLQPDYTASPTSPSARSLDPLPPAPVAYSSVKPREHPVGLGIVDAAVKNAKSGIPHAKRVLDPRRGNERADKSPAGYGAQREQERVAPPPRPERPHPDLPSGSSAGCGGDNSAGGGNGLNGGVSCSTGAQGQSANEIGQLGSGESVASPDAAAAGGTDITNAGLDSLLGTEGAYGGTSASPSVVGDNSGQESSGDNSVQDDSVGGFRGNAYPAYPGTRTGMPARRALSTLSPDEARKDLYEVVNNTMQAGSDAALVRRRATGSPPLPVRVVPAIVEDRSPNGAVLDDVDPGLAGAPGQSIPGAAIPGVGNGEFPGGSANAGAVGSSAGGRVIDSPGDAV